MSFGPSQAEKDATKQQQQVTDTAVANSAQQNQAGTNMLALGTGNTNAGTNWFQTLLNGNTANTMATLAPSIQQIRDQNQQQIQALSTLQPRGGGRSATLFSAGYAPVATIQNLFNGVRSSAAQPLISTGLSESGLGSNLYGIGNSALNTGMTGTQNLFSNALDQRKTSNALWSGLGAGLFGLATTPFGGGTAKNGLLGLIGGKGS